MEFIVNPGKEEVINSAKGKDTVYFKGVNSTDKLDFIKDGRNLIIKSEDAQATVINYYSEDGLKSTSGVKTIKIDKTETTTEVIDILAAGLVDSGLTFSPDKKGNIKGTIFNDEITGTENANKIYTQGGNDTIYSSLGNDSINLSKGSETLIYTGNFDNDKVYNFSTNDTITFTDISSKNIEFYQIKNDLILKKTNSDKSDLNGEVTLVNYFKALNKGTVGTTINLKDGEVLDILSGTKEIISDFSEGKGGTIKGSVFRDKIIGSVKNDIIYGNGNLNSNKYEIINAGKGKDKIYAGAGKVELKFKQGDGTDTVYLENHPDSLYSFDFEMRDENGNRMFAEIKLVRKGKSKDLNLIYTYDGGKTTDTIIIKNFYKNPEIAEKINIKNYITVNPTDDNKLSTLMTMGALETYISGNGKLIGTDYGDFITGGKGKNTITADAWTDYVYAKGGNDLIYLQNSLDKGEVTNKKGLYFNTGDGVDTIDTTGLEFGTILLYSPSTKLYKTESGNVIAGNMGNYTQNKTDSFYWNDIFNETITYGKTYDISNSKMIFNNFLNINSDIKIENLGNGEILSKEDIKNYIGMYEELGIDRIYHATTGDDYTICGKKYNVINSLDGDDVVVLNKSGSCKAIIDGGNGDDAVVINNISSGAYIKNAETIQINNIKVDNLRFIFNVDKNSEDTYIKNDAISICSTSNIAKMQKNNLITITGKTNEGDDYVYNFINTGAYIENNGIESDLYLADKKGLNSQKFDTETILRVVGKNVQDYMNNNADFFGEKGLNINTYYEFINYNKSLLSSQDLKLYTQHQKALLNIYKNGLSKNDTITSAADEGFKYLEGQKGDDTYVIKENDFKNNKITIFDSVGKNDTIILENIDQETTSLYFDVTLKTNKKGEIVYKKGVVQYTNTGDLQILKDIDLNKNISENNGIKIVDYFKKGKTEKIIANETIYDLSSIQTLSTKVANWLAENGYTSTNEVLTKGTVSAKVNLLLLYRNDETVIKTGAESIEELSGDDIIIAIDGVSSEYTTPPIQSPYEEEPVAVMDNLSMALDDMEPIDPSSQPTEEPTSEPTSEPTADPTTEPTVDPTTEPTVDPTTEPIEPTQPIEPQPTQPTIQTINGFDGNDIIIADNVTQKIIINGGIGNDTIYSGKGDNQILAEEGDDKIIINTNGDSIIKAGEGNDTIIVENVGITTYIFGDEGNDYIDGRNAKYYSVLIGGDGNDTIHSSTNNESSCEIQGGAGDDVIYTYSSNKTVDNVDNVDGLQKINFVRGGSGNDTIYASMGQNNIYVESTVDGSGESNDNDVYYYGGGRDVIHLSNTDHNDWIFEKADNDLVVHHNNENSFTIKDFFTQELKNKNIGQNIKIADRAVDDIGVSINAYLNAEDYGLTQYTTYGDDTLTINESSKYTYNIFTYEGNDVINISADYAARIYNNEGTDILNYTNGIDNESNHEKVNIFFNVKNTYQATDDIYFGDVMIFNNDENLDSFIYNSMYKLKQHEDDNYKDYDAITIESNSVETITLGDNYQITSTQLAELAESVASWLTEEGYSSVAEVVDTKDDAIINSLLAEFDKIEWQPMT